MNKGFYENDTDVIVIDEMGNLSVDVNTEAIKTKLLLENVISMVRDEINVLKIANRGLRKDLKNSVISGALLLVFGFGPIVSGSSLSMTFKLIFGLLAGFGLLWVVNHSIKSVKTIKNNTNQISLQSDLLDMYRDDYSKVLDKEEDYCMEMFDNNVFNEQKIVERERPDYSYFFDRELTEKCVDSYQNLLENKSFVDGAVKRKKLKLDRKF